MTLDDRVALLERTRHVHVAQINVLRTMLLSAWMTLIRRSEEEPYAVLKELRAAWLPDEGSSPKQYFPGADPIQLESASQDYDTAMKSIFATLESAVRQTN